MTSQTLVEVLRRADVIQKLFASGALLASVFVLRFLFNRILRRLPGVTRDTQRWLMVHLRNGLALMFLFGLAVIWATQLRTMALSIAAIAAAVVLAVRDPLACMGGTFIKTLGQSFTIGDRIEIDGIRGDVIDENAFTTTVLEIGPGHLTHGYTGRAVNIPNSLFLTKALVNESYTDHYVLHVFTVPLDAKEDWKSAEKWLLQSAVEVCQPFSEQARIHFEQLGRRRGLDTPSTEARVTLTVNKPGEIELIARVCVPARQKGKVEQAILRKYLEHAHVS
jgi:small-conductance mechanosensitive channel